MISWKRTCCDNQHGIIGQSSSICKAAAAMADQILMSIKRVILVSFFCLLPMIALATDGDPEQDFCVAIENSNIIVSGLVCKNPSLVNATDFVSPVTLTNPGNTNNSAMSAVTLVSAANFPGLNTMGISMARLDFAKGGIIVPHTHPRATELLAVVEGSLYVGFVDTRNKLFAAILNTGDVFVFPEALVHFQLNVGNGPAVALAGFNSQNPGLQQIFPALFTSNPPIVDLVLQKALNLSQTAVEEIRANAAKLA